MGLAVVIVALAATSLIVLVTTWRAKTQRGSPSRASVIEPGPPTPRTAKIVVGLVITVGVGIILVPVVIYVSWILSGVGRP